MKTNAILKEIMEQKTWFLYANDDIQYCKALM